jgi:Cellulose biosynthesis protein BcsS
MPIMMRRTIFVLAACALVLAPVSSRAGDAFTGFQIDNHNQYFGYLGVRTPLLKTAGGPDFFVQAMTAGLGYSFKSGNRILDANVQFIVPSLGISQTFGGWTLSALAGPQLRRIEEQRVNASSTINYQAGAYGQVEAFYWHDKWNLHAIGSYADLDNFFWSRLRAKALVYKPEKSCCATYVGWDVTGMGNADFKAILTGPVAEIQVGKVFLLARGGYQNSSSFHSGTYGGFEIYFPF